MRLLVGLAVAVSLCGQPYSLRLSAGQTASTPNVPAFNLSNYQWEIGISKRTGSFSAADAGQEVVNPFNAECRLLAGGSGVLLQCRDTHATSEGPSVDITGYTDVRFRWIRNIDSAGLTAQKQYLKVWDGGGGSFKVSAVCVGPGLACSGEVPYNYATTPIVIGNPAATFDIRFVRWGAVTDSKEGLSKPPVEVPTAAAGYLNCNLENSLADSSGHSLDLTLSSGAASYVLSPTYGPTASFGGTQYGMAGSQTITLSATGYSFSSTNPDGNPSSYAWGNVSVPGGGSGTIGTPAGPTTSYAVNDTFGTYVVQLQVTDASGTATVQSKLGIVPSNADGTIKYYVNPASNVHDASIRLITGPLTRYGTSPFVDFENGETANADQLPWAANVPVQGYNTALPGTVHVTNVSGVYHVICDDPVSNPCHFTTAGYVAGEHIYLWWNAPGDGKGRAAMVVSSISSDSDIVLSSDLGIYLSQGIFTAVSGYQHSHPSDIEIGGWYSGLANWNYYDNGLAMLRRYLRTGLDDYRDKFRLITDTHWIVALDHGYGIQYPRIASLLGLMARAVDGRPEMWSGLKYYMNYSLWTHQATPLAPNYAYGDIREIGYLTRARAVIAKAAQSADGTPDTLTREAFCSWTKEDVENRWAAGQAADGGWIFGEQLFAANYTYPAKGPGTLPWHMAFPTGGLILSRELMLSGACDAALTHEVAMQVAADALASLKKAIDFQLNYGYDSNQGMFYAINFEAYANGGSSEPGTYPGTAYATNGSATVGGVGTAFLTNFLPDGTTYLGIQGATSILRVDHAVSDGSLMLTAAATESASGAYSKAESCTPIAGPGLITINQNSTAVVGDANTRFTQNFYGDGNCDPLHPGSHDCATYVVPFGDRRSYQVKSVTDDQHMTLSYPFAEATVTNHVYEKGSGCTSHCSPSLAATCLGAKDGSRAGTVEGNPDLNVESLAALGYYYSVSGDASYKRDDLFTTTFPAGSYPTPDTPVWTGQAGKPYGQRYGAGDNQNYLAYRLAAAGPCSDLSVAPASASLTAGEASGTVNVSVTDQTCSWQAASAAPWLSLADAGQGTGNGSFQWHVTANTGVARSSAISVNGGLAFFSITQADGCTFSIDPVSAGYPAGGGTQTVAITASASSCPWNAASPAGWLSLSPGAGTGSGSVTAAASANPDGVRSAAATIAGQAFQATQAGAGSTGTSIGGAVSISGSIRIQ